MVTESWVKGKSMEAQAKTLTEIVAGLKGLGTVLHISPS